MMPTTYIFRGGVGAMIVSASVRSRLFLCVAAILALCACAAPHRELSNAIPLGAFLTSGAHALEPDRIDPRIARYGLVGAMEHELGRPLQILELSGGGQYGAFGAGFLGGWSASGKRPRLDLVNGREHRGAARDSRLSRDTGGRQDCRRALYRYRPR